MAEGRGVQGTGAGLQELLDQRLMYGVAMELSKARHRADCDAGVPLLIGTDTMAAGYNVHQELALFVESGLSPYQTLVAATAEPARYFDAEGEFGTIVEGASADMVLLDANPLDDIANASKISGVMLRGQWLSKADIQAERD